MIDFETIQMLCKVGDFCSLEIKNGESVKGKIIAISQNTIVVEENGNKKFISGSGIEKFESVSEQKKDGLIGINAQEEKKDAVTEKSVGVEKDSFVKNSKKKLQSLGKNVGFDALKSVMAPEAPKDVASAKSFAAEKEGNDWYFLSKIVPAKGVIRKYFSDRDYGFIIDDVTKKKIFFKPANIVDDKMKAEGKYDGRSVIYTTVENALGLEAIHIHKGAESTQYNLEVVRVLMERKNLNAAKGVLAHITEACGENRVVQREKEKLASMWPSSPGITEKKFNKLYTRAEVNQQRNKNWQHQGYNTYVKAKKLLSDHKFDEALSCFKEAIQRNINRESSIKDAASAYAQAMSSCTDNQKKAWYREEAINFLNTNESFLPSTESTWQHLENVYYAIKDYDNFLRISKNLLDSPFFSRNKSKCDILMTKRVRCFADMEKFEEALDLVHKMESLDPSNSQWLIEMARIYQLQKRYDEAIDIYDRLIEEKTANTPYVIRKATLLILKGSITEASVIIENVLKNEPSNILALRLKENIEKGRDVDNDIADLFDKDDFNNTLSPYIRDIIDSYEEFFGVPPRVIENEEINNVTLTSLRKQIESAKSRPDMLVKLLLTEAKIMTTLEPNDILGLKSVLAKYCGTSAMNCISHETNLDSVRFFYNEAFSLEENYDAVKQYLAYFLLTFNYTPSQLVNVTSRKPSVDDALNSVMNNMDPKKWDHVLSAMLYNHEITTNLVTKLFAKEEYRVKSVEALKKWNIQLDNSSNKDAFAKAWDKALKTRINDYKRIGAFLRDAADYKSFEKLIGMLPNILIQCREESWLNGLDTNRINFMQQNVVPALELFLKASGFRNKDLRYSEACSQLRQLTSEILDAPTKLSYEVLLPLIRSINLKLKETYNDVVVASAPKLTIRLLSSETVVEDNQCVNLQISVYNDKDSSPIRDVSVSIENSDDMELVEREEANGNQIEGGEEQLFKVVVKVSQKVVEDKAAAFNAICSYKNGDEEKTERVQLSLKLYSTADFSPIANPYAPLAEGGPVTDVNMFYGREGFINNIVEAINNSASKQYIIYGQKRCGKSSVLHHLKNKLMETGKNFCVSFSIGDILENFSLVAFYHKILSSIRAVLDDMELDGVVVPEFSIPPVAEFAKIDEDNPLNTFANYMAKFKQACKRTDGWANKKIVVMIDEFTYLYSGIKQGVISNSIMKQWKAVTQNERAQFSVVLVGQDVVPSFKKEDFAINAFGVITDIRLTYLDHQFAVDLIEKPILDENGQSRYVNKAVEKIIEYTSRNPYYIQIFCSRLVDYMNEKKLIKVTESHVYDVAQSLIRGATALDGEKNFDNLIRAGESQDLQEFSDDVVLSVLRNIAVNTKNMTYCSREDIKAIEDKDLENRVLESLVRREVLEKRGLDNYKIQVKLFQEWLLEH